MNIDTVHSEIFWSPRGPPEDGKSNIGKIYGLRNVMPGGLIIIIEVSK